eukprot:3941867-Rhodomonas_salina.1
MLAAHRAVLSGAGVVLSEARGCTPRCWWLHTVWHCQSPVRARLVVCGCTPRCTVGGECGTVRCHPEYCSTGGWLLAIGIGGRVVPCRPCRQRARWCLAA